MHAALDDSLRLKIGLVVILGVASEGITQSRDMWLVKVRNDTAGWTKRQRSTPSVPGTLSFEMNYRGPPMEMRPLQ